MKKKVGMKRVAGFLSLGLGLVAVQQLGHEARAESGFFSTMNLWAMSRAVTTVPDRSTSSPARSFMPRTPAAARPMARAPAVENRRLSRLAE